MQAPTSPSKVAIKKKRSRRGNSVALVFFRFSHRDKANQALSNKEQKQIVDEIYDRLQSFVLQSYSRMGETSSTYVPYYDPCLDQTKRLNLDARKVSENIMTKVQEDEMMFRPAKYSPSVALLISLPEFVPIAWNQSDIIDTAKR